MNANPIIEKFRKGDLPVQMRLSAAKGTLPVPPEDLLQVLFLLGDDPDPEVRKATIETVRGFNEEVLVNVLERETTSPEMLDFYCRVLIKKEKIVERVILNSNTPDSTIEYIADKVAPSLMDLIVLNQIRLRRHPDIGRALLRNPRLLVNTKRRIIELFEIFKREQQLGAKRKAKEAEEALSKQKEPQIPEKEVVPEPAPAEISPPAEASPSAGASPGAIDDIDSAIEKEMESAVEEAVEEEEVGQEQLTAYQKLLHMDVPQKIELALKGSREERSILIRDGNRVVATSVLKSPKLTEIEVEQFSASRNVSDEILRLIANSREWTKHYPILLNLVKNPKTPITLSMNLCQRMHTTDLKNLLKDRNIPEAVRKHAKRIHSQRTEKKQMLKKH